VYSYKLEMMVIGSWRRSYGPCHTKYVNKWHQ